MFSTLCFWRVHTHVNPDYLSEYPIAFKLELCAHSDILSPIVSYAATQKVSFKDCVNLHFGVDRIITIDCNPCVVGLRFINQYNTSVASRDRRQRKLQDDDVDM